VVANADRTPAQPIRPLHAFLLAAAVPLFLGGLLSDWAYSSSYEIQWNNFAAWLIAGGMVFAGLALLWGLVALIGARFARGRLLVVFLLVLAMFILGLIDSFVHVRDAWGAMPEGLVLSAIVALLAIAAAWLGFARASWGVRP
jgi:uncharacterized membrane protein